MPSQRQLKANRSNARLSTSSGCATKNGEADAFPEGSSFWGRTFFYVGTLLQVTPAFNCAPQTGLPTSL